MLRPILCLLLLLPATAFATNYPNMSSGDMQGMMEQMQKMQQCYEQIDQASMNELQSRTEQFSREIDSLCAQGKRDKAQKHALSFSREIASDPTMKQMQKCASYAMESMPQMMQQQMPTEEDYKNRHVCDN